MAVIEYFYAGYSAFAYIGHAELLHIAKAANRKIDHRPFDLRKLVATTGAPPIASRTQAHKDYFFGREIERWAEYRNIPIMTGTPTYHAHDITLSNCLLIAALVQGLNIDKLSLEMLHAHWVDDFDLNNPEHLTKICARAGVDPSPLLSAALSSEVREIYDKNTEKAIRRSAFGSPTYFIDGDMFYGQDHLELIAHTLKI